MILNWILGWWRGNALKDSLGMIGELLIWAVYEITLSIKTEKTEKQVGQQLRVESATINVTC